MPFDSTSCQPRRQDADQAVLHVLQLTRQSVAQRGAWYQGGWHNEAGAHCVLGWISHHLALYPSLGLSYIDVAANYLFPAVPFTDRDPQRHPPCYNIDEDRAATVAEFNDRKATTKAMMLAALDEAITALDPERQEREVEVQHAV